MVKPQLLWIDLEMTGLNVLQDKIIEIAALLTDYNLNTVPSSQFHRIIRCDQEYLDKMDEWCTKTHGSSGLTSAVQESKHEIGQVEEDLLAHLKSLSCQPQTLVLAGNSIHADRMFLTLQMPTLTSFLYVELYWQYRQVDVSSLKCLSQHWAPRIFHKAPRKKGGHRAMDDILESIEELRYYKQGWLKSR